MNANAIYLAVKGYFEDKISANVKRAMNTVAASCRNASKVMVELDVQTTLADPSTIDN